MVHELRYYQEIHALALDIQTLWEIKCKYIVDDLFRSPENLKIYYDGREEWLFDYLPTKREASKILVEASLPWQDCVRLEEKFKRGKRGRVK